MSIELIGLYYEKRRNYAAVLLLSVSLNFDLAKYYLFLQRNE